MSITTPNPEKPVGHNVNALASDDIDFALILMRSILADGYKLCSTYKLADYTLDVATLQRRLKNEGISFAAKILPKFYEDLMTLLEQGTPSFVGWKFRPHYNCPAFLSGLIIKVMNHEEDDWVALDIIYSLCHAFKKLKGPYPLHILKKQIEDFVEVDTGLGRIDYNSPVLKPIIFKARKYIDSLFINVEDAADLPRPGPGATNSPTEHHVRYEPHVMYAQLEDEFPIDEWFYAHPWDVVLRAREYLSLPKLSFPTSRFKFVHKYLSKPRGICIEENETQYCQQAVKRFLYKYIEQHPMTRGRVNFTEQSVNQKLALASSSDLSFATIDMSEASDRISRELVHRLFINTPLLRLLDAVSTRVITLPDVGQSQLELYAQKFAPMGSAVCFPIMATVHFALIKAIITLSAIGNAKEVAKHVYVYGDDIIIPVEAVQAVYDYLPLFGMKINKTKSFYRSHFRESCGVHAYKGRDITPVYNNYTLNRTHERSDTTRLLSLIAKEYAYHQKGYDITSSVIREQTSKVFGQMPFVHRDSPVLGWKRDTVSSLNDLRKMFKKGRYDPDTQAWQRRVKIAMLRYKDTINVEDSRGLLRWHLVRPEEKPAGTFMCSPEDLKIVWRWLPEHALG